MNILDEILANQVKILSLLSVSPVAASVEVALNPEPVIVNPEPVTTDEPVIIPNVTTAAIVTPTPIVTPIVQPVAATVASVGLIPLDKEGLPWDARINTVKPDKTVKGIWKAKKGAGKLDAVQTQAVKTELLAVVAANPPAYQPFGATTPAAAAAPVVAPVVVVDNTAVAKGVAITQINILTDTYKIEWEDGLEVLEQFGGAKSFDELAPEHYEGVAAAFKLWVEWLCKCQEVIDTIESLGGQQGTDGVATLCGQYGVATIAGVHHAELSELFGKLTDYCSQWVAAVAKAKG